MGRWRHAVVFALVAGVGGGCGGGPSAPSPEEICATISAEKVAEITGGTDVTQKAGPRMAPKGCAYSYTMDDGSTGDLIISVMTGSRVGNKTGPAALEHLLDELGNKDAPPLAGVEGRTAVHSAGPGRTVLAVDGAGRVVSLLLDTSLGTEEQAALTRTVLAGLAGG